MQWYIKQSTTIEGLETYTLTNCAEPRAYLSALEVILPPGLLHTLESFEIQELLRETHKLLRGIVIIRSCKEYSWQSSRLLYSFSISNPYPKPLRTHKREDSLRFRAYLNP